METTTTSVLIGDRVTLSIRGKATLPFDYGDGHAAGSRTVTLNEQYRLLASEI